MNVPFLNLRKEFAFIKKDLKAGLKDLFSTQHWILSEKVAEFEQQASRFLGCSHALGVSSGTDALVLALRAVAIQRFKKQFFSPDDEIIVPSFTFVASAESVIRAGGRPVFVDVAPNTFNMSPRALESVVTAKTKGIIVVHLFGLSAPMDEITSFARRHNLFIIEDCAQSFGAKADAGHYTGTLGDCGCFSFFPTKNLGAFGDAGMITAKDEAVYKVLRALRNHGGEDKYNIEYIGYNARLDAIQAQVLSAKLKHLPAFLEARRRIAEFYAANLHSLERDIKLPSMHALHTFNQYTIRVLYKKRDALKEYLAKKGIVTQVYYPAALHTMNVFAAYTAPKQLPVTEQLWTT